MKKPEYKAIIFDLDMTLVDSRCVAHHRVRRHWPKVMAKLADIEVFEGIPNLLKKINKAEIPMAIVTSENGTYCDGVISQFRFPIKTRVAYHDTNNHKPDPEPMLLAAKKLAVNPKNFVAIGDRFIDIKAANDAGMISIAAMWRCTAPKRLREEKPAYAVDSVEELVDLLGF